MFANVSVLSYTLAVCIWNIRRFFESNSAKIDFLIGWKSSILTLIYEKRNSFILWMNELNISTCGNKFWKYMKFRYNSHTKRSNKEESSRVFWTIIRYRGEYSNKWDSKIKQWTEFPTEPEHQTHKHISLLGKNWIVTWLLRYKMSRFIYQCNWGQS